MAKEPEVKAAWSEFKESLNAAPFKGRNRVADLDHPLFEDYDGSILYPSRIAELFFAGEDTRNAKGLPAGNCDRAQKALKKLLKALQVSEPNAYYGLLLADGDHMGAAIDNQKTIGQAKALSKALADFAQGVKQVVTRHGGSLIYSGGDDVLAMLPLHTALDCAEELARCFSEKLGAFETAEKKHPTLSVGLAIAHHLEDFADVRVKAGKAEKLAKNNGRNSLAIRLEKRGGSPVEVVGKWTAKKEGDSLLAGRLRGWIGRHQAGEVPNKLPFQWAELIRLAKDNPAMNPIVMMDAGRLVSRKGKGQAGSKDVDAIEKYLVGQTEPTVLESLSNELVLAKELERALRQSEPPHVMQEAR
jgi:CRISPR-associated protein Cmr2